MKADQRITDAAVGRHITVFFAGCTFPAKIEMVDEARHRIAFNIMAGKGVPFTGFCRVSRYMPEQGIPIYDSESEVLDAWRKKKAEDKAGCNKRGEWWKQQELPKCYTDTKVSRRYQKMTKKQLHRLVVKMVRGMKA